MRMMGLDAQTIFDHSEIHCWRKLSDRENCTLDADLPEGRHVRLHIKRYSTVAPVEPEVRGHGLLMEAQIPTAPLVGYGGYGGRGFVIFDDLSGFTPSDKLIERGVAFEALLAPTAELAAKLHTSDLHHRDLYLCHFMAHISDDKTEVKLIDTARVRRLPGVLTRRRWIVKDLAQFWYSTLKLPVSDEQRNAWLDNSASGAKITDMIGIRTGIEGKISTINRVRSGLRGITILAEGGVQVDGAFEGEWCDGGIGGGEMQGFAVVVDPMNEGVMAGI